jgi:hypothetical protein
MAGFNGINLPSVIHEQLGAFQGGLQFAGIGSESLWSAREFLSMLGWTMLLLFFVLVLPNTLQVLASYEPALASKLRSGDSSLLVRAFQWNASPVWAVMVAVIAVMTIMQLGGPSEFLYWQF